MVTPVTSEGSRSGVNWIREWLACTVAATARANEVFPVPGKSSSSRCPPDSRQVKVNRTTCDLPSTAADTLATSRSNVSANQAAWSGVTGACCPVRGAAVMSTFRHARLSPSSVVCPSAVRTDLEIHSAAAVRVEVRRRVSGVPELDAAIRRVDARGVRSRSEEHTSELQSRFDLVCRLLLEKKNNSLPKD